MNHFQRVSRLLMVAGFAALALAGCGKESPQALTESSKGFIAKGTTRWPRSTPQRIEAKAEDGEARYLLGWC
jgi:hypothetical protein